MLSDTQKKGLRAALDELWWTENLLSTDRQSMGKDDWNEVHGERYKRVTLGIRVIEGLLKNTQLELQIIKEE